MPKHRDLKRLTRARMKKTGESYTAARAELVKKRKLDFEERAGMSDGTVKAKTGRTWREWVRLLDANGARSMIHRDIAAYVGKEHGVSGWWSQAVTVGYERIRGLREIGQRLSGEYEAGKSKTLRLPIDDAYRAFTAARTRERWLPGVSFTIRTAVANKTVRATLGDATSVEAYFTAKGPEKTQITIQHRKLSSKAQVEEMKIYWNERLEALASLLKRG